MFLAKTRQSILDFLTPEWTDLSPLLDPLGYWDFCNYGWAIDILWWTGKIEYEPGGFERPPRARTNTRSRR